MGKVSRLKRLRLHLCYQQTQMAEILGIAQNSYSRKESGVIKLKSEEKDILEKKFHLSKGWLDGEDVPMFLNGDPVAVMYETSMPSTNREKIKEQILDELVDARLNGKQGDIVISREILEQIQKMTETILSQQKTIESMQEEYKKILVQMGNSAICAHVSGSDVSTKQ